MLTLAIPFRNLLRHRTRTVMAISAIGFGVIALLLADGFIQWIFWAMRESTIQSRLGHIQVVSPGYHQSGLADPFAYLLPAESEDKKNLENLPGVSLLAPRLSFSGLLSYGDNSISFIGEGVDVKKERELSRHLHITEGSDLQESESAGVLLGIGLARNLGVKPGDTVVLLVTTGAGGINAMELNVRGLFYTSTKAYDDTALRVPHDIANQLLRVTGTHRWIVLLEETDSTDVIKAALEERFPVKEAGLEFVAWHELSDFYNKTVALFSRQMRVLWIMIATIIVMTISNTLIRGMLERIGEIGTLLALGDKRAGILKMFLGEGLLLGLGGGMAGVIAGVSLAKIISAIGIPMPPPPGMSQGFTGEILVTGPLIAGAMLMAVGTSVVASLYPAWKASRLVIVDALRHNR